MNEKVFDEAESILFQDALKLLRVRSAKDAIILDRLIGSLKQINDVVANVPKLTAEESFSSRIRNKQTLVEHLVAHDGLCGELDLPLKASLQRSFLLAKIQCLRAFVQATDRLVKEDANLGPLNVRIREELAQSVYTQMAEELYLAILRKPDVSAPTKRAASEQLIAIWDNTQIEIDDFCPMLESAWRARNHMNTDLGSLLGATEYFKLVGENCSPQFLDFFSRNEVSEAENQAFSEFLFGLTWEDLDRLRNEMAKQSVQVVDEAWAGRVLGRVLEHDCEEDNHDHFDPIALYRSYQRRQLAADYRIISKTPGPRRTAEAYLLIYWLDTQA